MKTDRETILVSALEWLTANPGWWSRSEIALAIGRSKTSQLIRELDQLYERQLIDRQMGHEQGRDLFLYAAPQTSDPQLPF